MPQMANTDIQKQASESQLSSPGNSLGGLNRAQMTSWDIPNYGVRAASGKVRVQLTEEEDAQIGHQSQNLLPSTPWRT